MISNQRTPRANNRSDFDMATFLIQPVDPDGSKGWVVKTIHKNGIVETSILYETRAKAQAAADGWTDLDEDWAKV